MASFGELWNTLSQAFAQSDNRSPFFPDASMQEMERVRQEINPDGSGVLVEAAPEIAGAMGEAGGELLDLVPMNESGMGEDYLLPLNAPANAVPYPHGRPEVEVDPEDLPELPGVPASRNGIPAIEDRGEVVQMMDQGIQQQAVNFGEMAKQRHQQALNTTGDQEFFQLVKDASSVIGGGLSAAAGGIGDVLSMSFNQWQKLAPSTRTALVGAAATAYAYNRGWKRTAGDVAAGTAELYAGQFGQEETTRRQILSDRAAGQRAGVQAQQKAEAAQAAANAPNYTADDREHAVGQAVNILSQSDTYKNFFGSVDEQQVQQVANFLADEYFREMGGNQARMNQVPFQTWLAQRQQADLLRAYQRKITNEGPGTSVGGRVPTQ